MNYDMREQE
jgi:hypothetical protein